MEDFLTGKKHVHFIGIGGSGMYPLAQILHSKGFYLTGSDNNETETLKAVRNMGIPVYMGQRAENIEGADLIVYTAAIMSDNPELIAAKASGVKTVERCELLGLVTSWYNKAVCVSGTEHRPFYRYRRKAESYRRQRKGRHKRCYGMRGVRILKYVPAPVPQYFYNTEH